MSALDEIPGLAGYVAAQQQNQTQQMGQLQQMGAVQTILANREKAAKEQAFRSDLAALGPNPSQELLAGIAAKHGGPDALLKVQQASIDKQAQIEAQKQAQSDRLTQTARFNDMMHEYRMAQAKTNDDKVAETARHNKVMEDVNAQLKMMGLQIQRQGQQLQLEKFDEQKRNKEENDIEKQISKTADRLKDVHPVMTAARRLDSLLSQYTPENVPGVGYMKNTDTGKAFLSQEGKDVSSSIKLVGNAILKAMSGTAVTAPEEVRQMAAQMADGRYSAKDFYVAWPKVSEWLNAQATVATSSLTPAARDRYVQRTGIDLSPIKPRFAVEYQGGKLNMRDTFSAPPPPPGFNLNK